MQRGDDVRLGQRQDVEIAGERAVVAAESLTAIGVLAEPVALSLGDDGWIALPTTFGRYAAVHFAG